MQLVIRNRHKKSKNIVPNKPDKSVSLESSYVCAFLNDLLHLETVLTNWVTFGWVKQRLQSHGSHGGRVSTGEYFLLQWMELISGNAVFPPWVSWCSKVRWMWSGSVSKRIIRWNLSSNMSQLSQSAAQKKRKKSLSTGGHFGELCMKAIVQDKEGISLCLKWIKTLPHHSSLH